MARRAVDLDGDSALAHMAYAGALLMQGDNQAAIAEANIGAQLNPSSATAHVVLAASFYWTGRSTDALAALEQASRFNPRERMLFGLRCLQALCNADLGNLPEAEGFAREAILAGPKAALGHLALAAVLVREDRIDEAHAAIEAVHKVRPDYRISTIETVMNKMVVDQRDRFLADLRTAGLTDGK